MMNHPLLDFANVLGSEDQDEDEVLLSDRSGRISYRGKPISLTVTREHVFLFPILSEKEQKDNYTLRKKSEDARAKSMSNSEKKKLKKLKKLQEKLKSPILTLSVEDLIGMHYFPISSTGKPIKKSTTKSKKADDSAQQSYLSEESQSVTAFKVELYFYIPKKYWFSALFQSSGTKFNSKKVLQPNSQEQNPQVSDQEVFGYEPSVKFPLDRVPYTLVLQFEQSQVAECVMWKRAVHEAARRIVLQATAAGNVPNVNSANINSSKSTNNIHANGTTVSPKEGAENPLIPPPSSAGDDNNANNARSSSFSSQSSSPVPSANTNSKRVTRYSHSTSNNAANNSANNPSNNATSSTNNSINSFHSLNATIPYSPGAYHPHHRNTYLSALQSQNVSQSGSKTNSVQNPHVLAHLSNLNGTAGLNAEPNIVFPVFGSDDTSSTVGNSNNLVNNAPPHVFNTNDPYYDASFEDIPHAADPPLYPGHFRPVSRLERHFLVIISPKSGAGKSMQFWQQIVEPMLQQADVSYEVVVTQYYRHAFHLAQSEISRVQWAKFDCVILLGGDGIVYEVVNGLLARTDSHLSNASLPTDLALNLPSKSDKATANIPLNPSQSEHYAANLALLRRVTLCPLGGGSGNGLVASILHETLHVKQNIRNAVYGAVKGFRHGLDLTKVSSFAEKQNGKNDQISNKKTRNDAEDETSGAPDEAQLQAPSGNKQEQFAFLTLMWGMLADVDLDSEWLRCLGELRLYLYAVRAIITKRTYRGRISLQLVRSWSTYTSEGSFYEHRVNLLQNSGASNNNNSISTIGTAGAPSFTQRSSANSNTYADTLKKSRKSKKQPVEEVVDGDGWLTLEDDFVSVNIFQVSHIAYSTHVCPGKKLDEGFFLVIVVNKAISRWSMIQMLLTADDGGLLQNPHVRVFRASKYVIEPIVADSGKSKGVSGKFSLDGERIPYGRIEGEIVPNAARIML